MFSDTSVGFHDSSWDFGGQVNLETAEGLFEIIVREVKAVMDGKITTEELDAAKSYALGRHQMGAQTVSQISNFYSGRYFGDGVVKEYEKVPDAIRGITLDRMLATAREFIAHNTWVLAGVSSGEKEEIVQLNDKLETVFNRGRVVKVAIAWYGAEGQSSYRYFTQLGHDVTIVTPRVASEFPLPNGANAIVGDDAFDQLNGFDLVVRSSSVRPDALKTDGKIWSNTNEFLRTVRHRLLV